MTDPVKPNFNPAANQNGHVDPSIAYAEAFMDGEKQVTVTTRNGQQITYKIGQEFNYGQ